MKVLCNLEYKWAKRDNNVVPGVHKYFALFMHFDHNLLKPFSFEIMYIHRLYECGVIIYHTKYIIKCIKSE